MFPLSMNHTRMIQTESSRLNHSSITNHLNHSNYFKQFGEINYEISMKIGDGLLKSLEQHR